MAMYTRPAKKKSKEPEPKRDHDWHTIYAECKLCRITKVDYLSNPKRYRECRGEPMTMPEGYKRGLMLSWRHVIAGL